MMNKNTIHVAGEQLQVFNGWLPTARFADVDESRSKELG